MGHHNRHFSGDPYSLNGIWGPPTSAANFCEEDYAVTFYIAEFINALTNVTYIYYAFRYARNRGRNQAWNGHDLMSISLFLVGVSSFIFHTTLRQTAQLFDDLSMLLLGASFLLSVYTTNQTPVVQSLLATIICGGISIVSVIYLRTGNMVLHTISFGTVLLLTGPRTWYLIRKRKGLSKDKSGEKKKSSGLDYKLAKAGVLLVAGFTLWNIDLVMCSQLRAVRNYVGLPWAWLFELHGWWHILTAASAFEFIELVRIIC
ncbi:hypothetical protein BT63DRAFT_456961 [Microthyrium microscopicum]|uniref:Alkaline phytoceramidase n=1 Tax=Microthyrium microscopicum TaxID=703497 RepID=A0A6A6U7U5_9PEZI|nr:hypothetical protein BT63DRAFT_456961 [Microthyrium microscopicum]